MTLRSFLDAGYAILIEEYQRLGVSLPEALEKNEQWRAGSFEKDAPRTDPAESALARQNEASLQQFQQLMGGVQTT